MHNPYTDELEACRDARAVARCLLEKALAFCGAPMGHVQLLDRRSGFLEIAAQQGFAREFLDAFAGSASPAPRSRPGPFCCASPSRSRM